MIAPIFTLDDLWAGVSDGGTQSYAAKGPGPIPGSAESFENQNRLRQEQATAKGPGPVPGSAEGWDNQQRLRREMGLLPGPVPGSREGFEHQRALRNNITMPSDPAAGAESQKRSYAAQSNRIAQNGYLPDGYTREGLIASARRRAPQGQRGRQEVQLPQQANGTLADGQPGVTGNVSTRGSVVKTKASPYNTRRKRDDGDGPFDDDRSERERRREDRRG